MFTDMPLFWDKFLKNQIEIYGLDKLRELPQAQCVGPPFLNVSPFKYLEGFTGFPFLMTSKCK